MHIGVPLLRLVGQLSPARFGQMVIFPDPAPGGVSVLGGDKPLLLQGVQHRIQ